MTEPHLRMAAEHPDDLRGWRMDAWIPTKMLAYFNMNEPYAMLT